MALLRILARHLVSFFRRTYHPSGGPNGKAINAYSPADCVGVIVRGHGSPLLSRTTVERILVQT